MEFAIPKRVQYTAWNTETQAYEADDEANHTITLRLDDSDLGAPTNSIVHVGNGVYEIGLTDAERDGTVLNVRGTSSTENVIILPITYAGNPQVNDMVEDDGGGFTRYTAKGLEQGPIANVAGLALEASVQTILATGGAGPWTTATNVNANITAILGSNLTETLAGQVAAGLSYYFDVATPAKTMNDVGTPSDWTEEDAQQIRFRLGIDGDSSAPSVAAPDLAQKSDVAGLSTFDNDTETVVVRTNQDKLGYNLSSAERTSLAAIIDSTLTAAHGSGAWTTADLSTLQQSADRFETMIQPDGSGGFQYTTTALLQTPGTGAPQGRNETTGPIEMERPESGTTTFRMYLLTFDVDGVATDADATPTVQAIDGGGGDLSGNLGLVQNPSVGRYYVDYTVADDHPLVQVNILWNYLMATEEFNAIWVSTVVDIVGIVEANIVQVTGTSVTDVTDFHADVSGLALESSVQTVLATGGAGPWTTYDPAGAVGQLGSPMQLMGNKLGMVRGDTLFYEPEIAADVSLAQVEDIWFGVKGKTEDGEDEYYVLVSLLGGLLKINKEDAAISNNGRIVILQATPPAKIRVVVNAAEMKKVPERYDDLVLDVQVRYLDGTIRTLKQREAAFVGDVVRVT